MHRRGIYNSFNLSSPSRLMLTVLGMCQETGKQERWWLEMWVGRVEGVVSLESEVNPPRRNITCTNECARCLSLTLQDPALVFMGLEGFLLSGGSDRLSKVHCATHTNTRVVSVCVYVCARRGRWPSPWQGLMGLHVQQCLLVKRLFYSIRNDIKRKTPF